MKQNDVLQVQIVKKQFNNEHNPPVSSTTDLERHKSTKRENITHCMISAT